MSARTEPAGTTCGMVSVSAAVVTVERRNESRSRRLGLRSVKSECGDCGNPCWGKQCRECYISEHRVPESTCLKCGKAFRRHRQYNYSKNQPKYCSRECSFKALSDGERGTSRQIVVLPKLTKDLADWFGSWTVEAKRKHRKTTRCKACGAGMYSADGNGKKRLFCCRQCYYSYRVTVACLDCGTEVFSNRDEGKFCTRCQRRRSKKNNPGKIRKRCKKFGVAFNPKVKSAEVFERDGYKCQECRRTTSVKVSCTDSGRATVDHIVPLSLGGSHEWHNVQCLCRRCNVRKSNKYVGQRRLF